MTQRMAIHDTGTGAARLAVDSYGNGLAYNVKFSESGTPMRNLYFQGEDATQLRDELEALETANPEMLTRDAWLAVLNPYL